MGVPFRWGVVSMGTLEWGRILIVRRVVGDYEF